MIKKNFKMKSEKLYREKDLESIDKNIENNLDLTLKQKSKSLIYLNKSERKKSCSPKTKTQQ